MSWWWFQKCKKKIEKKKEMKKTYDKARTEKQKLCRKRLIK